MTEPTFFPGLDFPDREKWLVIRSTPTGRRWRQRGRLIYSGKKPLCLGINRRKRREAFMTGHAHGRLPKRALGIIGARHNYYRTVV
jgi:hypothetical protein